MIYLSKDQEPFLLTHLDNAKETLQVIAEEEAQKEEEASSKKWLVPTKERIQYLVTHTLTPLMVSPLISLIRGGDVKRDIIEVAMTLSLIGYLTYYIRYRINDITDPQGTNRIQNKIASYKSKLRLSESKIAQDMHTILSGISVSSLGVITSQLVGLIATLAHQNNSSFDTLHIAITGGVAGVMYGVINIAEAEQFQKYLIDKISIKKDPTLG